MDIRVLVSEGPFNGNTPVKINCIDEGHADDTASLAVYPDGAKCFGCGKYWTPLPFAAELWGIPYTEAQAKVNSGDIPEPIVIHATAGYTAPSRAGILALITTYWRNLTLAKWEVIQWLSDRGLEFRTCERARIGYTGTAYSIPIYDRNRTLQTIRYRRDDTRVTTCYEGKDYGPKYWGTKGLNDTYLYVPPLYNWYAGRECLACGGDGVYAHGGGFPPCPICHGSGESGNRTVKPVVLVEGELDALLLAQHGLRACSLTNGAGAFKREHVKLFEDVTEVLICYDADEPGQRAARSVSDALTLAGIKAHSFTWDSQLGKDATEVATGYPALFAAYVRSWSALGFANQ